MMALSAGQDEQYVAPVEVQGVGMSDTVQVQVSERVWSPSSVLTLALLAIAGAAWWLSVRVDVPMAAGLGAFLLVWLAMMVAMMLPALTPAVRLYLRASAQTAAPAPYFVAGYLLVWTALGVPAYAAWRVIGPAARDGRLWVGRAAGGALLVAAAYQMSPWKDRCLTQCRSPLGLFLRVRGSLRDPSVAVRLGARHALYCVGCCWAFMLVLVAVGVMQPIWMLAVAALVFVEKAAPWGARAVVPAAVMLAGVGLVLLVAPDLLHALTPT
jgi:predicted metal-binding membrane protein